MFAYCNNNPTNQEDKQGTYSDSLTDPQAKTYDPMVVYGGGAAKAIIIISTFSLLQSYIDKLLDAISQSFARAEKRTYKSPEEIHHIVGKKARNASVAAAILAEVLPDGVENPINKINIKTGLHRRLHRRAYYGIANSLVIRAYYASDDPEQQQQNVVLALGVLRGIIALLDAKSPY